MLDGRIQMLELIVTELGQDRQEQRDRGMRLGWNCLFETLDLAVCPRAVSYDAEHRSQGNEGILGIVDADDGLDRFGACHRSLSAHERSTRAKGIARKLP